MDHFPNIAEEHFCKKLPPALVWANLIICFLFLMYFFRLSKSLSLALATAVSIKIPNQNLIPYPENAFPLRHSLCIICIANSMILRLVSTIPSSVWSTGKMVRERFLLYKQEASEDAGLCLQRGCGMGMENGRGPPVALLFATLQAFPGREPLSPLKGMYCLPASQREFYLVLFPRSLAFCLLFVCFQNEKE